MKEYESSVDLESLLRAEGLNTDPMTAAEEIAFNQRQQALLDHQISLMEAATHEHPEIVNLLSEVHQAAHEVGFEPQDLLSYLTTPNLATPNEEEISPLEWLAKGYGTESVITQIKQLLIN